MQESKRSIARSDGFDSVNSVNSVYSADPETSAAAPALPTHELAAVVVPLLKGVLCRDEDTDLWTALLALQARVRDYVAVLLRDLARLTGEERAVFDTVRDNRLRPRVRLEHERIGFGWVQQALAELPPIGATCGTGEYRKDISKNGH